MKCAIHNADDLTWLMRHTNRFKGGQVTDVHVHKRRLYDESSGRDIAAGTLITAVIRYEVSAGHPHGLYPVTRVAKLTMVGVTDFSIFEQEGADFSEIGETHAEVSEDGRLRFWFDPRGELYVICDEAELEEVSRPGPSRPVRTGTTEWTFQADAGTAPPIRWLLDQLDRAGVPCAWRGCRTSSHPALCWEGHLVPATACDNARAGVHVQAFGPLDGSGFGITLRPIDPHAEGTATLLVALADAIARSYAGTCLAGRQVMAGDDWLEGAGAARSPASEE
ncbi:MAG: hypothetical protein ACREI3_05295 [Nitrospirales bacterium]